MNIQSDTSRALDLEHRRWLIGIGISVVFGLFGAVMAWLSYTARTRASAPAVAAAVHSGPAPTSGADPSRHRHRGGGNRD
ncbi:MAG: hypothetical protein ABI627_23585 [Polyangiaceae bacterium]